VITRAFGSPKMPRTVGAGRKPGKQYASHSRRVRWDRRAMHTACTAFSGFQPPKSPTRIHEDPQLF